LTDPVLVIPLLGLAVMILTSTGRWSDDNTKFKRRRWTDDERSVPFSIVGSYITSKQMPPGKSCFIPTFTNFE